MFGLFYMAANAIAYAISGTKMTLEDNDAKKRAIIKRQKGENRENLYMDHRGSMRDIETNQIRHVFPDAKGDYWLEGQYGNKIRNLSQEKRDEEFQDNVKKNPSAKAIKYVYWYRNNSPIDLEVGKLTEQIFKDVNNQDLYIKRHIIWDKESLYPHYKGKNTYAADFYMRVPDGMLVCLCENNKIYDFYGKEIDDIDISKITNFITFFNQKQKEGGWRWSRERDSGIEIHNMNSKKDYYLVKGKG